MSLPGPYTPGSNWQALQDIGDASDPGRIAAGAVGTVREVVVAGDTETGGAAGAGDGSQDVAVLEFGSGGDSHALAFTEDQLGEWFTGA